MREFIFVKLVFGIPTLVGLANTPLASAVAHEGYEMECSETGLNAMRANIQALNDGDLKTTAAKEMQIAENMMAEKDIKGCEAHMHNAMEAMEK